MAERNISASQKALKTRKRAKQKKPDFVKPESWRYFRLKEKWRRPRGIDNKMRQKVKGWPPPVSTGYRGPKEARGLHPSGYKEFLVHNPGDIASIDPKTEAVRIAHTVGKKKRVQIIAEAKKRDVFILNFKPAKEAPKEAKTEETAEKPAEEETEKASESESKTVQKKPAAKKKTETKEKEEKPEKVRAKAKLAKGDEKQ